MPGIFAIIAFPKFYASYGLLDLHCKKGLPFSRPQLGCHSQTLSLVGKNKIIPGQGEFGSYIPAGDGQIANLFLKCSPKLYAPFRLLDLPANRFSVAPRPQAYNYIEYVWGEGRILVISI